MRYQIPQFIEVEDRIFGPLTLKQFLYVAGGSAVAYIIYSSISIKIIAVILAAPITGFCFALAFFQYNNRPLIFTVESALKYFFSKKLYIWKKIPKDPKKKEASDGRESLYVPKLSESKLKYLSWSLDINEKIQNKQNSPTVN